MKKNILLIALITLLLSSCVTTGKVVEMEKETPLPTYNIPSYTPSWEEYFTETLDGVIEPEDMVFSPIIGIDDLKKIDVKTQTVVSSIALQDERKKELLEEYETDPFTDMTLTEDDLQKKAEELVNGTSESEEEGEEVTENTEKTPVTTTGQIAQDEIEKNRIGVTEFDFEDNIVTYTFLPRKIYEIITSPSGITDIIFEEGEEITTGPLIYDHATSWNMTTLIGHDDGVDRLHLLLRPYDVGLDTTMLIYTNKRTYYFRIASFEKSFMMNVKFVYPEVKPTQSSSSTTSNNQYKIDMVNAFSDFVAVVKKGNPSWIPTQVIEDGYYTYIFFPESINRNNTLPILSRKEGNSSSSNIINYTMQNNIYITHSTINKNQAFVLKDGNDVIEIRKR